MESTPRRKRLAGIGFGLIAAIAVVWSLLLLLGHHSQNIGLIENDPQAFPGYTLLAPIFSTTTYLIDMDGRVVNTWDSEYEPGQVAQLLENGHLLRAGSLARKNAAFSAGGGTGGRVQELAWDGELVWDFEYSSDNYLLHHDVKRLPNGNLLMIAWERKTAAQAIAAGRSPELQGQGELWPDFVIEVHPTGPTTGEIVWQWHVWDHLIQDHDSSQANYGDVALRPERIDVNHCFGWADQLTNKELDKLKSLGYLGSSTARKPRRVNPEWTHINAIAYNAQLDQIALSVLGFNELWIIDHSTTVAEAAGHAGGRSGKGGDLVYRWGNPQTYRAGTATDQRLFAQHDVHWIAPGLPGAGHLLLFNNGRHRPDGDYSSVEEIVPPADEDGRYLCQPGAAFGPDRTVWSYTASEKSRFYSLHISGAQRLPNGNTLICGGASGTLFEVTPNGNVVWKYINPVSRQHPGTPDSRPARPAADNREKPSDGPGRRSGPRDEPTNTVFRAYRYAPDYPGLTGKDLTPGRKLESSRYR
ncbi:MAG: aryl-sulfate sulfotransferase [Planctomycetota bacterium]|nr:aryl-sulfate sulfotransferase [Planctomycetota bacterium]